MRRKELIPFAALYLLFLAAVTLAPQLKKLDWSWLDKPMAFQWGSTSLSIARTPKAHPPTRHSPVLRTVVLSTPDEKKGRQDRWEALKAGTLPVRELPRKFSVLKPGPKLNSKDHDLKTFETTNPPKS